MKIKGVQQQWQEFLKACDPRGRFQATQRREMYRAFLAGFYSMIMTSLAIAEIDSENDGAAELEKLRIECELLGKDMVRGDYDRIAEAN